MDKRRMTTLLLVDDHPIVRQGLVQLLMSMDEIDSVREASSGSEGIKLFRESPPDAAVLDLTLGDVSGLQVLKQMKNIDPAVPVLILTMHDEALRAEHALLAGASGYVMKHEATETLTGAIRRLLAGELVFSKAIQHLVLKHFAKGPRMTGISALTTRETEILRLIGTGCQTSQIALKLSRSVKTIEAHRSSIRIKLGLESAFELNRFAMHWVES